MQHVTMKIFSISTYLFHTFPFFFSAFLSISRLYYCIYSLYGNNFDLYFMLIFMCRRGNNHFDVHFRRIGPYSFLSKDGKDAVREGRNGWKGVYFPPESASFLWYIIWLKYFSYLYLDLACKQLCFPPRKGINRRNESTIIYYLNCCLQVLYIYWRLWLFKSWRLFPSF